MTMFFRASTLAAAAFAIALLASERTRGITATRRCSLHYHGILNDTSLTFILAQSKPDTLFAGGGLVGTRLGAAQLISNPVFGQVAKLRSVAGANSQLVRTRAAQLSDNDIVVVPWGYGPNCMLWFWGRSARWTMPDSLAVFIAHLRPDSLWVRGRPTFDAEYAAEVTYAYGPSLLGPDSKFESANDTSIGHPNLTPGEFFELLSLLSPNVMALDSVKRARIREWDRAHPGFRRRFPAVLLPPTR